MLPESARRRKGRDLSASAATRHRTARLPPGSATADHLPPRHSNRRRAEPRRGAVKERLNEALANVRSWTRSGCVPTVTSQTVLPPVIWYTGLDIQRYICSAGFGLCPPAPRQPDPPRDARLVPAVHLTELRFECPLLPRREEPHHHGQNREPDQHGDAPVQDRPPEPQR